MSDAWEQKLREAKLKREFGAMPESSTRLSQFNAEQTDWYARCRKCGAELKGTLAAVSRCSCDGKAS